jgi:hypothetical protein
MRVLKTAADYNHENAECTYGTGAHQHHSSTCARRWLEKVYIAL